MLKKKLIKKSKRYCRKEFLMETSQRSIIEETFPVNNPKNRSNQLFLSKKGENKAFK